MAKIRVSLRDMSVFHSAVCSAQNAALIPEVGHALAVWIQHTAPDSRGILIGGLAMSFYAKPRSTEDADFLFLTKTEIPESVFGFKRHRQGAFLEHSTHVEIEVTAPEAINLPHLVAEKVYATAKTFGDLKVASLDALIVLKLFGADNPKRHFKDLGDISILLEANPRHTFDHSYWSLSPKHESFLASVQESLA